MGESAALQVLHDYPEFLLHQSAAVHFNHVLVPVVPHDHHLRDTGTGEAADDVTQVKLLYLMIISYFILFYI